MIPTAYARIGDWIYLHGAPANYAMRRAVEGDSVCLTVTLVDALVLARSAFHHSINYRSVVVFGVAQEVEDFDEKRTALMAFVDHVVPGRSPDTRPPSDSELRATRVVKVEIEEASAKVRTGGPKDDPEDLDLTGIWAGEMPLQLVPGAPQADSQLPLRHRCRPIWSPTDARVGLRPRGRPPRLPRLAHAVAS